MPALHRRAIVGLALASAALAACGGAEENAEAVDSAQEALTDSADAVSGFGPVSGDTKAPGPAVRTFRTRTALWIWSSSTTSAPLSRTCGDAATSTAASRFAGPSAPRAEAL